MEIKYGEAALFDFLIDGAAGLEMGSGAKWTRLIYLIILYHRPDIYFELFFHKK
jgi:hypothetical protein